MGARKLKNGAGDGANIHVFNIKPDAILPNYSACLQARHQTPRVQCISIHRIYPPGINNQHNSLHPGCAGSRCSGVARGGMATAGIEPYIMSNITVIKVRLHTAINRLHTAELLT